jgi:AcrR family transcriptional regulator
MKRKTSSGRVVRKTLPAGRQKAAPKRGYHHGDLKEALCRAALELVAENGPRGVKLAEVCRRARVSVAAPYRHFADKNALLAMVAERGFSQFAQRLERVAAKHRAGSLARLEALARAYVAFAREQPDMFGVMFGAASSTTERGERHAVASRALGVFVHAIVECQQAKTLPRGDPEKLAIAMWAPVHGLAVLMLDAGIEKMDGSGLDPQWIPSLVHTFVRGLTAAKTG